MRGVHEIAMRFERRARRVERVRRPAESREASAISASATTHLARATASRGPKARAARRRSVFARDEIAELRHRDPAQRERRRIVAQCHALQRAEGIARGQRLRCSRDQRVHRNPVTLVTPTTDARRSSYLQLNGRMTAAEEKSDDDHIQPEHGKSG